MTTRRWTCVFVTCAAVLMAAATGFARQAPPAITGDWQATLGRQHLTLAIEQGPGSTLKATFGNVEAKATTPIDSIAVDDARTVTFTIAAASASFTGTLNADGTEISGMMRQAGAEVPLVLRRPGTAARALTLKPATKGRVHLEPCRTTNEAMEALCGTYEVFENREARAGRTIALNVMVIPATTSTPQPDPFFALAGGPGESAVSTFPLTGYVRTIREQRDVVLIDQRGTGKSNPLPCPLIAVDNAQEVIGAQYSLDRIRECRTESDRKADTTQYTTSIAADDVDEVRDALGYGVINVFGASYGSRAALVYLRRHGDHVRTLTIEQIAPPAQFFIPLAFATGVDSSVDGVIALCEADAACHKGYPDVRAHFAAVVERLDKAPAQFEIRRQHVTLTREMFLVKLRTVLYVPQFVSAFPLFIESAYAENWIPYADAALQISSALDEAIARGASLSAICAEDVPMFTSSLIHSTTEGTRLGDSQAKRYQEYCKAWGPAGVVPKDFYTLVHSNVPALLLSGDLDPGTPPQFARQAAEPLTNSRLVSVKQGTHGTGSPCIDGLIAAFVAHGSVAGLDASCTDQIHIPSFLVR